MFCPNCGNQLSDNAKFCGACGTPITAPTADASSAAQQPYAAGQEDPAAQQPYADAQQTLVGAPQAPSSSYFMGQQNAAQPAGVYAGTAAASKGVSKGIIAAIAAVAIIAVVAIVVFVVKPFGTTPESAYAKSFNDITADGAFKEEITFDMTLEVPQYYSMDISMYMNLDIQNYDQRDLSKLTATGSGYMEMPQVVSGRVPFDVEISNGTMTMDMGMYGSQSQAIDMSDVVYDTDQYKGMWDKAEINGNTITLNLSDAEMKELMMSSAAGSASDVSDFDQFTFDTSKYIITLDDANNKITTDAKVVGSYSESGMTANVSMDMSFVLSD